MGNALTIIQLSPQQLEDVIHDAMMRVMQSQAASSGELWSARDLARHYGVSERTISNWEHEGRLPKRSGTRWRRADVLKFDADRKPNTRPI